jgi:hypothetical protein
MSKKNKAPKLFVVEKKTASGKSWSKKIVAEARTFTAAVDKLHAIPGKVGDYRIVKQEPLRTGASKRHPGKVLAVRSYSAPEVSSESVNDALARLNATVNA